MIGIENEIKVGTGKEGAVPEIVTEIEEIAPKETEIATGNAATVKKSVLQAQSLRVRAKIGRIDRDRERERRKRKATAMNCRSIIQSWTRRKSRKDWNWKCKRGEKE